MFCTYCFSEILNNKDILCKKCKEDVQTYGRLIENLKETEEIAHEEAVNCYKMVSDCRNLRQTIIETVMDIHQGQKYD